jgi:hypothetical protein
MIPMLAVIMNCCVLIAILLAILIIVVWASAHVLINTVEQTFDLLDRINKEAKARSGDA